MTPRSGSDTLRPLVLADLAALRWPMEPAISPSGEMVAYVVSGLDESVDGLIYQLHVHDRRLGTNTRVAGGVNQRKPRWSRTGEKVAYLSDDGHGAQLVVAEGVESTPLAQLSGGLVDFDWSPKGDSIVGVSLPDDDHDQATTKSGLYLFDVARDSAPERLGSVPGIVGSSRWSPTGEVIACAIERSGDHPSDNRSEIWLVPTLGGSPTLLASWKGPISALAWRPDGLALAVLGNPEVSHGWDNSELWVVPLADEQGPFEIGRDVDRSIGYVVRGDDERGIGAPNLAWTPDGDRLMAMFAERGTSSIFSFTMDGRCEGVVGGERSLLEFSQSEGGAAIAFSWSDPLTPGALSIVEGGVEKLCTNLNRWLYDVNLARTTHLPTLSSGDVVIDGWLTTPAHQSGGHPPLIVHVHGGPHYPVGLRFSFDAQRLAALGFAVLRGNPRGSHGYGHEFAASIRGDWGGGDHEDLMDLVDAAIESGSVDPDRIAIVGESYGGYAALWAISHTSRFSAAISENGISDVLQLANQPSVANFWETEFGASVTENPESFVDRSPLTYVGAIAAPLLLIHAEDDTTCPVSQSEALEEAMRTAGKPVTLLRVPAEGHFVNVFGRLSSRTMRTRVYDDFLVQHLLSFPELIHMRPNGQETNHES